MKKNIIILLCSLPAMLLLTSCGHTKGESEKESAATEAPATPVVAIQKGKLSSTLKLPGELVAFQQVDIYAKVSSFVKKLNVDVGSEVNTGDLLVTMEAPELTAQLNAADSRLKSQEAIYLASKANYDRLYTTSLTPGTVSKNDLDQAKAKMNSDLANLEAARSSYREVSDTRNYLEIRAPFAGIITARNVSAGAYVGPTGKGSELPIVTLQEQRKLRLVISVPESYTSYLGSNSEVNFTVKAYQGKQFTAKVNRLAGALDARLRSQRIEMDVTNNDKKLLPGMIAEVNIPMNTADSAFILPKTAVVNSTVQVFVVKVENNKAVHVPVSTGREVDGKIEVFGDLKAGDMIVATATEENRDGQEIKKTALQKDK
ncbi:efflux RND transporter periplasmic adaptor subunit [Chitinophaga sancti]|uniref:efflux RND transporter periplasmic adaptor subunit n=1 Tax=Chitinophaga sancti TaxID=1004 RepID=UPI002A755D7C|nr:efflux RND transporter periplasmic adaptor subunit [Chitinophaga sancti]WPQ65911.1 efflux RND transporter periplasmic adaptor subunit [Chitinophaga sancti]